MYSILQYSMFNLLFYYWLQVSVSKGHHQANIYKKKLKTLVHIVQWPKHVVSPIQQIQRQLCFDVPTTS